MSSVPLDDSVVEGMNGLELRMHEGSLDERRQGVVVDRAAEVDEQGVDVLGRRGAGPEMQVRARSMVKRWPGPCRSAHLPTAA